MQSISLPSGYSSASASLTGRSVLITGAGGGLGGELAIRAAQLGATVILAGRTVARLERVYDAIIEGANPQPAIYPIDFSGANSDDYDTLAETLRSELGGIDAIVHCAASTGPLTPLTQYPVKDWQQTLHVNLTAPMLLTRACLSALRDNSRISIAFTHDDKVRAYWGAYGVAKTSLLGLVKIFAEELEHKTLGSGERQFSVNAVLPGPMRTALRQRAYPGEDARGVPSPGAYTDLFLYLLDPANSWPNGALLSGPDPAVKQVDSD